MRVQGRGVGIAGEMVHALGAEDMMVIFDGCRLSITCREREAVIAPHPAPSEREARGGCFRGDERGCGYERETVSWSVFY